MSGMSNALIEQVGDARDETHERRVSQSNSQASAFARAEMPRPSVHGKFLFVADQKFWIRGVTYGTFKPNEAGDQFPAHKSSSEIFGLSPMLDLIRSAFTQRRRCGSLMWRLSAACV